jgi:hypothetical protein
MTCTISQKFIINYKNNKLWQEIIYTYAEKIKIKKIIYNI